MRLKILVLALVLLVLGVSEAQADGRVTLLANNQVQSWNSAQRFGPRALIVTEIYVGGTALEIPSGNGGCIARWMDKGIAVSVNTCGANRVPIRLRYVSLSRPIRFTFTYQRG